MSNCGHSKLYMTDFANQPEPLGRCLFCERDALQSKLELRKAEYAVLKEQYVKVCAMANQTIEERDAISSRLEQCRLLAERFMAGGVHPLYVSAGRQIMDAVGNKAESPDLNKCPGCGGPADNGHDRCVPPSPYYCTKCSDLPES